MNYNINNDLVTVSGGNEYNEYSGGKGKGPIIAVIVVVVVLLAAVVGYLVTKKDATVAVPVAPVTPVAPAAPIYTSFGVGKMCRGADWNAAGWPKGVGYKTNDECKAACTAQTGCTAYDLARLQNGKYDCYLFGHSNVVPEPGASDSDCYKRS